MVLDTLLPTPKKSKKKDEKEKNRKDVEDVELMAEPLKRDEKALNPDIGIQSNIDGKTSLKLKDWPSSLLR